MNRRFPILVLLSLAATLPAAGPCAATAGAASSTPAPTWAVTYGGAGAEEMEALLPTPDGGVLIAGVSSSYSITDTGDALIVKTGADGTVEWAKTYGGADEDMALDIKPTADNGYVAAGWTKSSGAGGSDAWIFKLDGHGNLVWERTFGGPGEEQACSIATTPDGGSVVVGGTNSFGAGGTDLWVLKLDGNGNAVWKKSYGTAGDDAPPSDYGEYTARVVVDADGRYVVGTNTASFGNGVTDIWVLGLAPEDGGILWQYTYGDRDEDAMWHMQEARNGGYLIAGLTTTAAGDIDSWVLRLGTDGTVGWQKTYPVAGKADEALSIAATSDGGALVGSYYEDSGTKWDSLLVRIDAQGAPRWSRRYHTNDMDWPNAVTELPDNGFAMLGVSLPANGTEDILLARLAPDGTLGASCAITADLPVSPLDTSVVPTPGKATAKTIDTALQTPTAQVRDVTVPARVLCAGDAGGPDLRQWDCNGNGKVDLGDVLCELMRLAAGR